MAQLVSILIPAYNAEKWIGDTIRSAINQTWPRKEIIIVDDGSFDNTLAIAKQFESGCLKVISQENRGACAARNRALEYAQGDYIQWLDADDLFHPEKIAYQLRRGGNRESRTLLTCSWGKFYFRHQQAKIKPNSLWNDAAPVDWILRKFMDNVWMNPTVWLVSRRLIELAGPWDERLSISGNDDGEYICRVVAACENVKYVPESKCYYRIGNIGSLNGSMGETDAKLDSLFLSLKLSINHLRTLEDSERTRVASLVLLQTWFPEYYPERQGFIQNMSNFAQELGGNLTPPEINWQYYPIKMIFGWRTAKRVMKIWRHIKVKTKKEGDRLLYSLSSK